VIGEASRFPQLGRLFVDRGQRPSAQLLEKALKRLNDRKLLEVPDAAAAASQFTWLVLAMPINTAMLTGDDAPFTPAELDRLADQAARTFERAYTASSPPRRGARSTKER
jgi:TetR/AcrR family transcriptional regulator, mexJK operon transcriptional repressor